jgi:pimeloyl-ACP methyl ester carboxylesterase
MTEIRRIVVTRYGQVHARLVGFGSAAPSGRAPQRPLVLLHMSPRSSQMWSRLQALLPRPSIALDRLGYGFSDAPPRALSMAEYAESALDAIDALQIGAEFDLLGMHTGCLEAIELAHLAEARVRRVGLIAIPCFNAEENAAGLASFAQLRVTPLEDGSHLTAAWRARFQYRRPPWDLADVQRRLVDYLLAPHPGAAYGAVFRYDAAARLAALRQPVIAFAPRDDVYDVTLRSKSLLPPGSTYVDLPDFELDFLRTDTAQFAELLARHLPPLD